MQSNSETAVNETSPVEVTQRPSWSNAGLMLLAGVAGGALSWLLIVQFGEPFKVSPETAAAAAAAAASPTPVVDLDVIREYNEVAHHNQILQFGIIGFVLGGLLCSVAAALCRSRARALVGLLAGSLLVALFGALGALGAIELHARLETTAGFTEATRYLIRHLTAWGCLGAGAGLSMIAAGQSVRRIVRYLVVGVLSGVLVVVAQQLVFTIGFPFVDSNLLIPDSTKLGVVWSVVGGGSIGLLLGYALVPRTTAPRTDPDPNSATN